VIQVRRLGLKCALSARLAEGSLYIVDDFVVEGPKTKLMVEKLNTMFGEDYPTVLFVDSDPDREQFTNLKRAVCVHRRAQLQHSTHTLYHYNIRHTLFKPFKIHRPYKMHRTFKTHKPIKPFKRSFPRF
jgi:ribosomal protein L4